MKKDFVINASPKMPINDFVHRNPKLKKICHPITLQFLCQISHKPNTFYGMLEKMGHDVLGKSADERKHFGSYLKYLAPLKRVGLIQKAGKASFGGVGPKPDLYDLNGLPSWLTSYILHYIGLRDNLPNSDGLRKIYKNRIIRNFVLNPFDRKIKLRLPDERVIEYNVIEAIREIKTPENKFSIPEYYLTLFCINPFYFSLFLISLHDRVHKIERNLTVSRSFTNKQIKKYGIKKKYLKKTKFKFYLRPENFLDSAFQRGGTLYNIANTILTKKEFWEDLDDLMPVSVEFYKAYVNKCIDTSEFDETLLKAVKAGHKNIVLQPKIRALSVQIPK